MMVTSAKSKAGVGGSEVVVVAAAAVETLI